MILFYVVILITAIIGQPSEFFRKVFYWRLIPANLRM